MTARFSAKIGQNFFEWCETLRVDETEKAELEMETRVGLAAKVVVGR